MAHINFEGLALEPIKKRNFEDILSHELRKKRGLEYGRFNRLCGVSYSQWLIFREKNPRLKCSF